MCEDCLEKGESRAPGSDAADAGSRRLFLLLGLSVLAGCAKQTVLSPMPSPPWPAEPPRSPDVQQEVTAIPRPTPPAAGQPTRDWRRQVLPRSAWAQGQPIATRMNPMSPIRFITVHHDGMDPFFATDRATVAAHLEQIRQLHRRKGWGDIGYHFAVDRAGRVWEGRPLDWQGAHVKDHNPGNIGVVVLGNFEQQQPTAAQLDGVRLHLSTLMRVYKVPLNRVHTHREWGAPTACPGNTLQRSLLQLRNAGGLG